VERDEASPLAFWFGFVAESRVSQRRAMDIFLPSPVLDSPNFLKSLFVIIVPYCRQQTGVPCVYLPFARVACSHSSKIRMAFSKLPRGSRRPEPVAAILLSVFSI
jgi:hypothetical protein